MFAFGRQKKQGAVDTIVTRMRRTGDSTDYQVTGVNKPQDSGNALDACCEGMIRSIQSGDSKAFRENLDQYVSMHIDDKMAAQKSPIEEKNYGKESYSR